MMYKIPASVCLGLAAIRFCAGPAGSKSHGVPTVCARPRCQRDHGYCFTAPHALSCTVIDPAFAPLTDTNAVINLLRWSAARVSKFALQQDTTFACMPAQAESKRWAVTAAERTKLS